MKGIIEKQKELIKLLNDQIALVTGDEWKDSEKYGYSALALSQKITQLESELSSLQGEQESKDPNVVCDQYHIRGKWSKEPQGAEAYLNNNGIVDFIIENNLRPSIKLSELLEQYHRAMTKEELIKFMKHCYDYRLQGTYDEIADKYLNQKK